MRILLVLLIILIIAYVVLMKRKKARRKGTRRDVDRKYTYLIDCPVCIGIGEVLIINTKRRRSNYYELKWEYEHYKEEDLYHYYVFCYYKGISRQQKDELLHDHSQGESLGSEHTYPFVDTCPFCEGKGTAYARFETRVKFIQTGAGELLNLPEKGSVHVKTHRGGSYQQEPEKRIVDFQPGGIHRKAFSFRRLYVDKPDPPRPPARFCFEITPENRDFFANAKPRF